MLGQNYGILELNSLFFNSGRLPFRIELACSPVNYTFVFLLLLLMNHRELTI